MSDSRKSTPLWQLAMLAFIIVGGFIGFGMWSSANRDVNEGMRDSFEQTRRIHEAGARANRESNWTLMEKAGVTTKECEHCKTTIALRATRCPNCTGELTR